MNTGTIKTCVLHGGNGEVGTTFQLHFHFVAFRKGEQGKKSKAREASRYNRRVVGGQTYSTEEKRLCTVFFAD